MKKIVFVVLFMLLPVAGNTQEESQRATVSETMTVAASVTQFAGATTAALTRPHGRCSGILETAAIRVTTDGTTPSATVGEPVLVNQEIEVLGRGNIGAFKAFRQTGTSGVIYWTCYQ